MLVKIRVSPQASKLGFAGRHGDAICVKLTKGAHDGEANEQLIEFLSKQLHISKSEIFIEQGHHRREKLLAIPEAAAHQLTELVPS